MAAVALHVRRWGSPGEPAPVLLVHATGDTSADWDEVATGLAHDRLVAAPKPAMSDHASCVASPDGCGVVWKWS